MTTYNTTHEYNDFFLGIVYLVNNFITCINIIKNNLCWARVQEDYCFAGGLLQSALKRALIAISNNCAVMIFTLKKILIIYVSVIFILHDVTVNISVMLFASVPFIFKPRSPGRRDYRTSKIDICVISRKYYLFIPTLYFPR